MPRRLLLLLAALAVLALTSLAGIATAASTSSGAQNRVGALQTPDASRVGLRTSESPCTHPGLLARSAEVASGFCVAAEGEAAGTRLYRIAGPNETADIEDTGGYRLGRGQEGKNFYPTQEQAVNLAQMYNDAGIGGPYSLTSGVFSPDLMDTLEPFNPVGEGPSYFARGQDSLDQIFDVQIHGPVP